MTSEAVLLQVSRMAFVDVRRLVDATGKPIPLHLLPADATAAIQDVVIKNHGGVQTYKVRLCDRNSATGSTCLSSQAASARTTRKCVRRFAAACPGSASVLTNHGTCLRTIPSTIAHRAVRFRFSPQRKTSRSPAIPGHCSDSDVAAQARSGRAPRRAGPPHELQGVPGDSMPCSGSMPLRCRRRCHRRHG